MVSFCLVGAGRIGTLHARNIAANPRATLRYVVDAVPAAAERLARTHGATPANMVTALDDPDVDAVLVASSTDTHVDLITVSAGAGKAVLCEKPIDLAMQRVDACLEALNDHPVPLMIGFNRRFDPSMAAVHAAVRAGEVGDVHLVVISSRDPAPPGVDYIRVSGGQFRDMTIHDFDMARWLLGEEPVEVTAMASCLIDPAIAAVGDVDTLMVMMKTASGALCHINNSRKSVYGYDQRVEVFGSKGMVRTENQRPTTVRRSTATATEVQDPLLDFFLERYAESYRLELDAFIDAIEGNRPPPILGEDGRQALKLANAALQSHLTGQTIRVL